MMNKPIPLTAITLLLYTLSTVCKGDIIESEFKPHPLLKSAHLQTSWSSLFHRESSQKFRRQRLELPDGDFLDLDWFEENPDSLELIVLIHGLGGSSASPYISRVGNKLVNDGFRVVVFNLRGATDPNRLPRSYHSGETEDLDYVLNFLSETVVHNQLHIVGFSLGGNMLLKWLGENGRQSVAKQAVAVSVPFDLAASALRLDTGTSRVYRHALLANLKHYLRLKEPVVQDLINLPAAYRAKTFHQFDDIVTAPLNGFRNVDDYYQKSSSRQFLGAIHTPTLILHARDDPFTTTDIIPSAQELGNGVTLELSDRGGHVGFVGKGRGLSVRYWLPERISHYFSNLANPNMISR